MLTRRLAVLLALLAAAPSRPRAEPPPPVAALVPKLDKLFADEVSSGDLPGLGVGIVYGGELVYARGFGARDLASKAPFDADTVFRIASVTKGFTSMAILKLRDEGKLALDAPAKDYYPPLAALALPTKDSPPVTVRQLMTHASGLPEDNNWVDVAIDMTDAQLQELLRSGMSFAQTPDVRFQYSNIGYAFLGKIIERVSGMPAREYIRREILAKLGMKASGWEIDEIARDRLAVGYWGADGYQRRDKQKIPAPIAKDGVLDVAGGLYSTVNDMSRYVAAHLAAWPPRDDPETLPVRRATIRELQQGTRRGDFADFALLDADPVPFADFAGAEPQLNVFSYGGGWFINTDCSSDFLVEHSGGLPGYSTQLTMLPRSGFGIIVFVNDARVASRPDLAALELFREAGLLEEHPAPPHPALVAAQRNVDRLLASWDTALAAETFEPTFYAYHSDAQLREEFGKLVKAHGSCRPAGALVGPNRLRGRWEVTCDRGAITFGAALSPRGQPKLQVLRWRDRLPPSAPLTRAAAAVVRLTQRWSAAAARAALAKADQLDATRERLAALGRCTLGAPVDGDGTRRGVWDLSCGARKLRLTVGLDEKSGKIAGWRAAAPRAKDAPYCVR